MKSLISNQNRKEANMITETTYYPDDLTHGVCRCCEEESDEILKGDGRCVDCVEEELFINMTMAQGGDQYTYLSQDLEG